MSLELARQAITSRIEQVKAQYTNPNIIIEYDNRTLVDRATQKDPFIMVDILYLSGEQASIGLDTYVRTYGQILFSSCVKENTGLKAAAEIVDFFSARLEIREFNSVRTFGASPQKFQETLGWYYLPVVIPFYFDRVANLV